MVRQLLFPKEGGGFLRRFIGIRLRLYKDAWSDDRPLRGPMSLFDFRQRDGKKCVGSISLYYLFVLLFNRLTLDSPQTGE